MVFLLAALLPGLYWQGGPETAPLLQKAGITHILVPASRAASWKNVAGIDAQIADLQGAQKLPAPGVSFRMSEASATRVPWVTSNGWQFMRRPKGKFYYDVNGNGAALAAAEAFCYDADAIIKTDASGLEPLGRMLKFLSTINPPNGAPVADIGFIDDGSPAAGEVMNLLVRDNLLFKVVASNEPDLKLTVRFGSAEYPATAEKNPVVLAQKIRANLTDDRRSLRMYGTSIVVTRLTAEPGGLRLHLLNYGAAAGARVGAFRVRVLGRYRKGQLRSFDSPSDQLIEYNASSDATEFTVPGLKAYAVVNLAKY
jgi:hypothetical protein